MQRTSDNKTTYNVSRSFGRSVTKLLQKYTKRERCTNIKQSALGRQTIVVTRPSLEIQLSFLLVLKRKDNHRTLLKNCLVLL